MELNYGFMVDTFFVALKGLPTTLGLTALSLFLAVPIAFYMAVVRMNESPVAGRLTALYISFVRGTPIILQILLIYSLLPSLLHSWATSLGLGVNVFDDIDPIVYACVVFTLNTIAVLSEVFRSALLSIPKGQLEAGLATGISAFKTYLHVIVPQAMVVAIPGISNVTVNLVKGTSLAFLMTVKDVMAMARIEAAYGYNYIEAYLDVFVVYIIICTIVQLLYDGAERYFGRFRTAG